MIKLNSDFNYAIHFAIHSECDERRARKKTSTTTAAATLPLEKINQWRADTKTK